MKIILFIFLSFSLYASDILSEYRKNGIQGIEKQLDLELAKTDYWDTQLQNIDTSFGYIKSYTSILTCDKNTSTLSLYQKDLNNTFLQVQQYSAFTGKSSGDKKVEGDLRTPIGIYNIKQRLDKNNKLDPFYGPLAFVTSYPNLYDKMHKKNGSGIWIHGLPINHNRDKFTKGCIAIDNKALICLDNNISIDKTILIINPNEIKQEVPKKKLSKILAQLYMWRYTWKYNKIVSYLAFYDKEFQKADRTKLEAFKIQKEFVFARNEKKTILFKNINIFKYPNTQNIYQITFDEYYNTKYFKYEGKKLLMIKLDNENNMQIFLEN